MSRPASTPAVRRACDALWTDPLRRSGPGPAAPQDEFGAAIIEGPAASRRQVLWLGAAAAMASLGSSVVPAAESLPHVGAPDAGADAELQLYATATTLCGLAQPLLVRTHMGRPIKVEGNDRHPASQGATDAFAQAQVLSLYDRDRSAAPSRLGRPASWDAFGNAAFQLARELGDTGGRGFAVLTGCLTSPTQRRLLDELSARFPAAGRYVHDPTRTGSALRASALAFGAPYDVQYRLDGVAHLVCLDADPLGHGPTQVAWARRWSESRSAGLGAGAPPTLAAAEPTPTLTGARAADRLTVADARIPQLAVALAAGFGIEGLPTAGLREPERQWVARQAEALRRHGGDAVVVVGDTQPEDIQALAFAINARLGSLHRHVELRPPAETETADPERSLAALAAAIADGRVARLLILDSDPAFTGGADLGMADRLRQLELAIHVGLYPDETARLCHWHLPLAHPFESWGDARAVDGTATLIQPLVRPIRGGREAETVLLALLGRAGSSARDEVRATWRDRWPAEDAERGWQRCLEDGFIAGTAPAAVRPPLRPFPVALPEEPLGLTALFRPDPGLWDGRFAANPLLQELPKPLSKATWSTVVALAPLRAQELGIGDGDAVTVRAGAASITGPAWVAPGQSEADVTIHLGGGRGIEGEVGYDAYLLRKAASPWRLAGVTVEAADDQPGLAQSQIHQRMAGRDVVERISLDQLRRGEPVEDATEPPSLYPPWTYPDHAWAMVIDTDLCIGCNACVLACQTENNVPVVGRGEVERGRLMHWLRVDRYHAGEVEQPRTYFEPVPCMHCEKAPCEVGCPVNATVHTPDGLNAMVYNRCIGTRTCASYCPYKVRRFNWFGYADREPPARIPQRNPEVTVRERGVMEKCTYCVQRISAATIAARREDRPLRGGEVVTACQGACPTRAIHFGDLNDEAGEVRRLRADPRHFTLLRELSTRPRTTYLATIEPADEDG